MAKYVCTVCGFVYDEALGIPEKGIAPGTTWDALPEDWTCPFCGAEKSEFAKQEEDTEAETANEDSSEIHAGEDTREMTPLEISALCSNLARGCDQQYKPEEATLFRELAEYFKQGASNVEATDSAQLLALIEKDLEEGFPKAKAAASAKMDRGALRALVWSEKVTRILKSLLTRYQAKGDTILENTNVYVCTICGFVYIGDSAPDLCPVCKAPQWKFEQVQGRSRA